MLVELGYSLTQIGVMVGVAGSVASLGGALTGGWAVGKLGRKRSLVLFAALMAPALATLILPATGRVGLPGIYAVFMTVAFVSGMATAALYTAMMDHSEGSTPATDFTVQQALAAIGPLLAAAFSGFSADRLGFAAHFALAAASCLVVSLLIAWRLKLPEPQHPSVEVSATN